MTTPTPESGGDSPELEPTDDQLRSDEARRYRQKLRETEAQAAQVIQDNIDREARLQATERLLVDQELAGKFADPRDFWTQTELTAVRDESGVVDLAMVAQRADELLSEHPHWASPDPRVPQLAPTSAVGGQGLIGFGPRSVLDVDNVMPQPARSFGQFLTDAANATPPPD
ncbi:hypothetical protein MNAB215_5566 [Mycobacterium numidiamassiliense]|uniref:Uncharacterized protein n=1 Tax=Mycobacterium numidiamassiliense TaxID=1841861 RepID=A0A2U3PHV3_9MYCO|nr:hypothetical protein [Mycobacterium numidiamassiliense]SPM43344.1 hypothetical protein MNAB215_5566 [Mycobacterium numidiamassiliense]